MVTAVKAAKATFRGIGDGLYWKGNVLYARLRVNGKWTWRSTGTDSISDARKWLDKWKKEEWMEQNGIEAKGVLVRRERVTVAELIESYIESGLKTRKMRPKQPSTITNEKACLKVIRAYFGGKQAAALSLADCDAYRDWRTSGGYFADSQSDTKRKKMARLKAGTRSVDLELTILANVLHLAMRRGVLKSNPIAGRSRYSVASDVRHCREVAPTPANLNRIEDWLRERNEHGVADVVCFLACTGLRIGEALVLNWKNVDLHEMIVSVKREKKGIFPWVPILPDLEQLLQNMQKRKSSELLFPSPFDPNKTRDSSAIRHRLAAACRDLKIGHVTPHGLRSYFVTRARSRLF